MTKESLNSFADKFYSDIEKAFAEDIYELVKSLKLDDLSANTAFLLKSDLSNDLAKKTILEKFDTKTLSGIELLKRISGISVNERKKNIVNLRKHFIDLSEDISIIIIKLAERLVSLRKAEKEKLPELIRYAEECLYFYSPIAQMLGIRRIYTEMEDIAFKTLFPDDFAFLEKKLTDNMPFYTSKISEMKTDLVKSLSEHKIDASLQARVKRPYSIYRKIIKQKIAFEKISDLLALRVITKAVDQCYLTLGIVHNKWTPIDGRFRDWITFPKSNGYRSIQTTVHTRRGDKFEIQIRTEQMHEEAEYGASAHWAYKQGGEGGTDSNWLRRLHDFLDNDEYFDNPLEFFDKLKVEMKRDHINVLTPKGEIISLPEKSTPIDYAFAVHTNLGYNITGARINGKFAKLKTELKSGDVIEVISQNSAAPSRDWLNIVKTSRARTRILRWFKKNEKDIFISQGKNAWDKLKEQHKRKLQGFEDEAKFRKNLALIGYTNPDDFYYAVSAKNVKCSLFMLKKLYPEAFKKAVEAKKKVATSSQIRNSPDIIVEGLQNIEIKLSKCCNPIKGEPIAAYITKKSEMKIHSAGCSFLKNSDPANIKKAEWAGGEFIQVVKFKLYGESYGKVLSAVVECADKENVNIISTVKIFAKGDNEGMMLEAEINGISQLESLLKKLRSHSAIETIKSA